MKTMPFAKTGLLLSILVAASLTHAQSVDSPSLMVGGPPIHQFGWELSDLQGSGSLAFSLDLVGALSVAGIQTTILAPSTGTIAADAITVSAPIASLDGLVSQDQDLYTAHGVRTIGGVTMLASTPNFATSGGSLSVTNIRVDLTTKSIYANVAGGNGLPTQMLRVWHFANVEGNTTVNLKSGTVVLDNSLTQLTITDEAFDAFAQGLGLKAGGIASMSAISDYGVMSSTLSFTALPEPSTYVTMGLGLVGLALVAMRRKTARQSSEPASILRSMTERHVHVHRQLEELPQ